MATDLIGPLLIRLRDLAAAAIDPEPGRIVLAPGSEVADDDCCEGQVHARLIDLTPRVSRPLANGVPCLTGWTAQIGVGVMRCAHTLDDNGDAPTPAELDEDTLQMTSDLAAVEEALRCSGEAVTPVQWLPRGPQGGCVGGEWVVTAIVPLCGCSDSPGA